MRVLICGGGVIGTSIAYFLSLRGVDVTVIERADIACAASGKSGGFLALDWCDGTPLAPMARRSFMLHGKLADDLSNDWGYRRLPTYAGAASARNDKQQRNRHALDWLANTVNVGRRLGTQNTTAQVDPAGFTKAMMRAAETSGARLIHGTANGLLRDSNGRVTGVDVDGKHLDADAVVIAMGPWSILASGWVPLPGVYGLKGHSIVFDTGNRVSADALFLEYEEADGELLSPEIMPRTGGTTYVCGLRGEDPLPVDPADVVPDRGAIERLRDMCTRLSPVLADAPILTSQACFRPVTEDGLPLIGAIPDHPGIYVATGHSVWGILNAPATGEAMAELIVDGKAHSTDLSRFNPGRMKAFDASRLRGGR